MWTNLVQPNHTNNKTKADKKDNNGEIGIKELTSLKAFPSNPTVSLTTQRFSTPRDRGMRYGQRVYGYFVPPETGNYIFAVSCTNNCDLLMSKNELEEKKEVILTREKNG